ncbi:hypothetical protein NPX13_g5231 [Xylaria arbuscula]|uniref:Uncharacterized protein n=1 Tax=Xylaria arbuscula TaxID=114810 RepID=A0A9W8NE16_9PEZI|nr:hypothetical protein NPX13_g5231 [Xylaria arbuscula]
MPRSVAANLSEAAWSEQNDIEHSNFEHIKLTLWNLPEFNVMTHGNRAQERLNLEIEIYSASLKSLGLSDTALTPTNQVILSDEDHVFFNEDYEKHWWQALPEALTVTSLVLKVRHDRTWKPATLDNLVSRVPNLEEFRYEHMPQDPAANAIPIHHNPSFSAKR